MKTTMMTTVIAVVILLLSGGAFGATSDDMQTVINRVDHGRQEVEKMADDETRRGNEYLSQKEYFKARDCYIKAKTILAKFDTQYFASKSEFCDKQIAKCYYEKANDAMENAERLSLQNDFEEAIKECKEALKYCPEQSAKLEQKIEYLCQRRDLAVKRDNSSTERLAPGLDAQDYQIELLMEQGRRLVAAKEWGKALRKFQEVLLITPYHSDAMQNIQAINSRIRTIGHARYANERRKMMAEAEWKNAIPFSPEANSDAAVNLLADEIEKDDHKSDGDTIRKKLESIVVPETKFKNATVAQSVRYLNEASRRFDNGGSGVNFIYMEPLVANQDEKQDSKAMKAATSDDEESEDEEGETSSASTTADVSVSNVDLDMKNSTLKTVLESICRVAGLRYRIEREAIVLAPVNVALDELVTKFFAVDIPEDQQEEERLRGLFESTGVKFPAGAKLFYDNKINRLVAINTVDDLQKIEKAIPELFESQTPMIQIMIKFVEVSQSDIDELGFNWQFGLNLNNKDEIIYKENGEGLVASRTPTMQSPTSNSLLRYYKPDGEGAADKEFGSQADYTYQFFWGNDKGTSLIAQIFALNWADSSDVLYSPRVTTLDQHTAKIAMYQERCFPTSFENIDIETPAVPHSGIPQLTAIDPQPNLDSLEKLGLRFEITPTIKDLENGLIELPVSFPIRTFSGWKRYDARSWDEDGSVDGDFFQLPIFDERTIKTNVLIRDGETVVLAGVASDITKIVHDKIPILGDIPIVGRLFQSKYTDSQKGNLLVFLTCRLVKADGSAYNPAAHERRGTPRLSGL